MPTTHEILEKHLKRRDDWNFDDLDLDNQYQIEKDSNEQIIEARFEGSMKITKTNDSDVEDPSYYSRIPDFLFKVALLALEKSQLETVDTVLSNSAFSLDQKVRFMQVLAKNN